MKKSIFQLTIILCALLTACADPQKEELENLKAEVMRVHDESMAQMGTMHDLESGIKSLIKTKEEANPLDSTFKERGMKRVFLLGKAHTQMMDWMHQYKAPKDTVAVNVQIEYFKEQKVKIDAVDEITKKSITEAKAFLESNKN